MLVAADDGFGNPTIGWGHTGRVKVGDRWTLPEAEYALHDDLQICAAAGLFLVHVQLNDEQWISVISFIFNLGQSAFARSTLLKYINAGQFSKAAAEFLKWDHANGRPVKGLTRRRVAESQAFIKKA